MSRISKRIQSEMHKKIVDTAFSHFQKKGYDQTNIREITQEVGIAEGTLYNYFPDKATLFLEAMATRIQLVIPEFSQQIKTISSTEDLQEFLTQKIHILFSFPKDTMRKIIATFIGLNQQDSPLFNQLVSLEYQYLKELRELFDSWVEKGLMKNCDTQVLSSLIYGILIFEMLNYLFDDECNQVTILKDVQKKVDFLLSQRLYESETP